jgi:hypothetical protein
VRSTLLSFIFHPIIELSGSRIIWLYRSSLRKRKRQSSTKLLQHRKPVVCRSTETHIVVRPVHLTVQILYIWLTRVSNPLANAERSTVFPFIFSFHRFITVRSTFVASCGTALLHRSYSIISFPPGINKLFFWCGKWTTRRKTVRTDLP